MRLRVPSGDSRTSPRASASGTLATTRCSPSSATRRSRYSMTSGKLCPVSTCITGKGMFAGANAFWASRSITMESLPPEKSSTGRSISATTSRITKMLSASSASRCETWYAGAVMTRARFARSSDFQTFPVGDVKNLR